MDEGGEEYDEIFDFIGIWGSDASLVGVSDDLAIKCFK